MKTETKVIRILTADDHALLRGGIASLVAIEPDMELVAQASTGREAIEQFRRHRARRDDAEAAGVRDGGDEVALGDPGHGAAHDGVVAAEEFAPVRP